MDHDVEADAIAFGTDGWRATLAEFTSERLRMVGQAVVDVLDRPGTVVVGYDARDSSPGFAEDLAGVLAGNGFDVLVPERDVPTPVVAWTVSNRGLSGALMVTASHNPPEYNGVKFLPPEGAPAPPETTERIEAGLAPPETLPESERGEISAVDLVEPYVEHALATVEADLSGATVVYDAMHGSGRGVTDRLLERADADVERLRCETDPTFGGESPEPAPERLEALVERVAATDATLGVANDGDADRITVVTPGRGALDPNLFFAATYDSLLAGEALSDPAAYHRSGDVVRTVSTSSIVDRVAETHGQGVHETPVGFKHVAAAMAEGDALMGGEESGGFGLTTHLRNKDGVLLALVAAAVAAERPYDERVAALLDEHGEIHQDRVSVDCPEERKGPVLDELDGALPDRMAGTGVERVSTVDGFKVFLEDSSWTLVRPSGTEPKLRVYAEARSAERVGELLDAGRNLVEPLV